MIAPLRWLGRALLHAWGAVGRADGWRYQVIERWGALLAEPHRLPRLLPGGQRIDCDLRELVDRFVYFQGLAEPVEAWLLLKLLRPGMVVVDAGANIGQYTLLASQAVRATGRVVAFEPVAANHARLKSYLRDNNCANVTLHAAALWDSATTLTLSQPPDYQDNAGTFATGVVGGLHAEQVPAVAFDDLAASAGIARVDVVKMDIEGSEARALAGMRRTMERDRPLLLIELNRVACERAGMPLTLLWQLLVNELGYRAWRIGSTPADSGPLDGVDGIEQVNAFFYYGDLPSALAAGWSLNAVLRWARAGDRAQMPA